KKRRRTTPAELNILEHEFRSNMRPDPLERARIAERLGMTARAVQVWYQNRR
ncbi:homeobox domain-containing protein, partial [Rhodotorula diobovata]